MKKNDINHLLNGLLGEEAPKEPAPPKKPEKKSAASEKSRQRVEEISRSVEMESLQNRSAPQRRVIQTIPKRDPVPVPPPISHFSDEPSQNPAVRMRDRLDETALPMLDAERKPTQIIPPKPKQEPQKKRRKKRPQSAQNPASAPRTTEVRSTPVRSSDIPAPQSALPPKRKIPHIVVPDELPPDIPRDTSIADEIRRRKQLADEQQAAASAPKPMQIEEPEPPRPAAVSREEEITRKAELIKQRIRLAMEQTESEPAPQLDEPPVYEEPEVQEPEMQPEPIDAPVPEEIPEEPKKRRKGGLFHKKKKAPVEIPAEPEYADEPEAPAEPEAEEEPIYVQEPVYEEEPVHEQEPVYEEPESIAEPELPPEPEPEEKLEFPEEPETVKPPETSSAPRLRHLSAVDEPKERGGLFGRFGSKKKQKLNKSTEKAPAPADTILPDAEDIPVQISEYSRFSGFSEEEPEISEVQEIFRSVTAPEPEESPKPVQKWERSAVQEMPEESRRWGKRAVQEMPEPPAVQEVYEVPEHQEKSMMQEESAVPEAPAEEQPQSVQETSIHVVLPDEEKQHRTGGFASAIRAALDENVQELADEKAEPLPEQSEIDVAIGKSRYVRRRTYFMAGIICSVFALVGIAACVMLGIRMVRDFTDSSSLRAELEDVLYPVAVVDLPDFEQASDAAPETLLSAAMIDLLMYADLSGYPESFDMISIPAQDVQKRADEMFGTQLSGDFVTLYAAGETFYYDEATGCYNVPTAPVIFSYAPDVQEIRRSDDIYTVTVKYRSDTAQWQQRSENFDAMGEKTMEITLQKNGDDYQLLRIMNISEQSDAV